MRLNSKAWKHNIRAATTMRGLCITSVILVLCFKIGRCAYCDQQTIPFPGVVKNSTRFYLSGESFAVSCEEGHRAAIAKGKFTCTNGYWTGHFPPCIPNDCLGPPPFVDHGRIKSVTGQHLSKAIYDCDEHYFPDGDYKVQCLHGKWTGTKPNCKDSRCYLRDLRHTDGVLSFPTNVTQSGDSLAAECSPGYQLNGLKPLCVRGVWTDFGMSPCSELNCTTETVRNGASVEPKQKKVWTWSTFKRERTEVLKKVLIGQQKLPGTVLYVACNAGYTFQGKGSSINSTTCIKGIWLPEPDCRW